MANVIAELFQNTANAIREKTGETGTMKPLEFPDKIRAIQAGAAEPNLIPLSVTENGTYYPTGNIEHGKTYTFKNEYTQAELKSFYEASLGKSDDGMYAILCANLENGNSQKLLGIMYYYGYYGVYISNGYICVPEELASTVGLTSGWNFGTDLTDLTPTETPSFSFDTYELLIEGGLTALNPLFDLPEADGFSYVEVNVEGGGAVAGAHTLTFLNHDGSVLYEKQTVDGDDSYDPIEAGKIEIPTKESNVQYHYTYNGWSLTNGGSANESALKQVKEDRTLYADFEQSDRLYTVRIWDGETLVSTNYARYGETFAPTIPSKDGYEFVSWTPSDFVIYGDTDYYANWKELSGWMSFEENATFTTSRVQMAAYHPTEKRFACYESTNKKVAVYDTSTVPYTKLFDFEPAGIYNYFEIFVMEYSDDGKYLMMAGSKTAQIMDTTTEPYVSIVSKSFSGSISSSSYGAGGFIPYTTDLVLGERQTSSRRDSLRYNCNLGALLTYDSHCYLTDVAIDRLGTKVAIAKTGGSSYPAGLCVYDIDTAELDSACSNITDKLYSCVFDYSGRYILVSAGYGNGIKCYDTSTNPYTEVTLQSLVDTLQTPHNEYNYVFSTKGNEYLFFRDTNKKLVCYDMRTVPFRYVEDFPEITHTVDGIVARRDLKEFMVLYRSGTTHTFLKSY